MWITDLTYFPLVPSVYGRIVWRAKVYMRDWKLERGIVSSKREKQEIVKQLWESVMQYRNYWRWGRVIMEVRRMCMVLCALQLQRGGVVSRCKTRKWTRDWGEWSCIKEELQWQFLYAVWEEWVQISAQIFMMGVEGNAQGANLRHKFWNKVFRRFILEQESKKIQLCSISEWRMQLYIVFRFRMNYAVIH